MNNSQADCEDALIAAQAGYWEHDVRTGRVSVHPTMLSLLGLPAPESPCTMDEWNRATLHPDDLLEWRTTYERHLAGTSAHYEHTHRRRHREGDYRWLLSRGKVEVNSQGRPVRVRGIALDITSLKQLQDSRLQRAHMQVREVHHRVKNHLQGTIGLLSVRAREHPAMAGLLAEAIGQIEAVALVNGLQGESEADELPAARLTRAVVDMANRIFMPDPAIKLTVNGGVDFLLAPDKSVTVALIINELITNALKHRSPLTGGGVRIELSGNVGRANWRISNPGVLPEILDLDSGQGLGTGLRLVCAMLSSPGARLSFESDAGSVTALLELEPPLIVV